MDELYRTVVSVTEEKRLMNPQKRQIAITASHIHTNIHGMAFWPSNNSIHKYLWRHTCNRNSTIIIIYVFGYDIESAHTCSNNSFFWMGQVGSWKIEDYVYCWTEYPEPWLNQTQLEDAMSISYWQSTYWHVQSLTILRIPITYFLLPYYVQSKLHIHTCKWIN